MGLARLVMECTELLSKLKVVMIIEDEGVGCGKNITN